VRGAKSKLHKIRTFGTSTPELLGLRDWLAACGVTHAGMESTGVYWQPVYAVLEDRFELAGNARHIKAARGRKTEQIASVRAPGKHMVTGLSVRSHSARGRPTSGPLSPIGGRCKEGGMEYFHVSYIPPDDWVRPIITRLRQSSSAGLRQCAEDWGASPLSELGIAVATKRAMLPITVARVNEALEHMIAEFNAKPEEVDWCLSRPLLKGAFCTKDRSLPYQLLVDLESFLFEFRSTYEIVGRFLREFFGRVLRRDLQEAEVVAVLETSGRDTQWVSMLKRERVVFFHHTAPWIVFEVERGERFRYRLVVLKKNSRDLSNPQDYVRL